MIDKEAAVAGPEQEVERFLGTWLKDTEFKNKAHAVGGYVRDEIMGKASKDLDIVIEMDGGAKKITKAIFDLFKDPEDKDNGVSHPMNMGESYPIWQITFKKDITFKGEKYSTKGAVIEFVDTMKEAFPDESSRQRDVEYATLEEDIARRDFTMNMGLKDLTTGEYKYIKDKSGKKLDFVKDIKDKVLRGHPDNDTMDGTFSADPLRLMRLVRFLAKYNFDVPEDVKESARRVADRINIVSDERVQAELVKILDLKETDKKTGKVKGKTRKAIEFMKEIGLLKHVLPEIEELAKTQQSGPYHLEGDVFKHTMMVLDEAPATLHGQLAALLHDVGKPSTQEIDGEKIRFLKHEHAGGKVAEKILRRLKFRNSDVKKIRTMVENHMRPHQLADVKPSNLKKKMRQFVDSVGEELVESIFDLAQADGLGKLPQDPGMIEDLKKTLKEILHDTPEELKKPVLSGKEIMDLFDLKGGPLVGKIKSFLITRQREAWDRHNKIMTEEDAKKIVRGQFRKEVEEYKKSSREGKAAKVVLSYLNKN
jgi:poly(A) polymerase